MILGKSARASFLLINLVRKGGYCLVCRFARRSGVPGGIGVDKNETCFGIHLSS